jgi:hypothetical protein
LSHIDLGNGNRLPSLPPGRIGTSKQVLEVAKLDMISSSEVGCDYTTGSPVVQTGFAELQHHQSISTPVDISTESPQQTQTRNFSRNFSRIISPSELPSTCVSESSSPKQEEVVNLIDTSFIKLSTPEPLQLDTGNQILEKKEGRDSADQRKVPQPVTRASTVSSRPSSPTKLASRPSTPQSSSFTTSRANAGPKPSISKSLLENFFAPYAAPGPEEYPQPEDFEMERGANYTRSPTSSTGHRPQASTSTSTTSFANTVGEKLGWFRSRGFPNVSTTTKSSTATSPTAIQQRHVDSEVTAADPLFNLDIESALFPDGPADPLDPASFITLLHNATSLIETLQTAYKARTTALNDIRADYAAQTDELDESETRARHWKMQLSDMSLRMADTETSLRGQLVHERQMREELELKEKERAAKRRANPRPSALSSASDSGFESDTDGEYQGSPLDSPVSFNKHSMAALDSRCTLPGAMETLWEMSALQGSSDLTTENYMLRQRVTELEGAVDACLRLL